MVPAVKVSGIEPRFPNVKHVVQPDAFGENRQEIVDSGLGNVHPDRIVKGMMDIPGMNQPPLIAEAVAGVVRDVEPSLLFHCNVETALFWPSSNISTALPPSWEA